MKMAYTPTLAHEILGQVVFLFSRSQPVDIACKKSSLACEDYGKERTEWWFEGGGNKL
jgi:hypothetical protein